MKTASSRYCRHRGEANQAGVGLVEILVAIIIISIGFLAVGKMQIEGMRYSQSAYFSAQANLMLKDITDRMRSNRRGLENGDYDNLTTAANLSSPSCIDSFVPCTPGELAERDLFEWSSYLYPPDGATNYVPMLPNDAENPAKGTVTRNMDVFDIAVQWSEKINGEMQTQIRSVQLIP